MPILTPRPPYAVGTVTLTNGSAIVTGSGTSWLANAYDGDLIVFISPVTGVNMVASVQTNTSLTLAAPWTGATTSGVAYAVSNTQGQSAVNLTIARLQSLLTTLADVPTSAELAEALRLAAQAAAQPQGGGRLTTTPGVAVPVADAAIVTELRLTPFVSDILPIFDGTVFVNRVFGEPSLALTAAAHPANNSYDVWAFWNGTAVVTGTGPAYPSPGSRGSGPFTNELNFIRGIPVNKNTINVWNGTLVQVPANRAVLVGSFRTIADGQAIDTEGFRWVSSALNRVPRIVNVPMPSGTWVHSADSFQVSGGGSGFNAIFVVNSLGGGIVDLDLVETYQPSLNTAYPFVGIGVNSTTVDSSIQRHSGFVVNAFGIGEARAKYRGISGVGANVYYPLERVGTPGAATVTWYGGGPGVRFQSAFAGTILG